MAHNYDDMKNLLTKMKEQLDNMEPIFAGVDKAMEDIPDKCVWCVFCYHSTSGNDQDYDVLKGIFDSEEKAVKYMKELEKINKSYYKSFGVDKERLQ